jgi:hypothetical protein
MDVDRAHLFFCTECEATHKNDAFNAHDPIYRVEIERGHCEFCDEVRPLAYCQWLLCDYCGRVIASYRKGKVSATFALAELQRVVAPAIPGLAFREVDPVVVQVPKERGHSALDFEALLNGERIFLAELKTGQNSIEEMKGEFQLDLGDCDDIMRNVRESGLPTILLHCHITKEPQPPTMRYVGSKVWWADLWDFAAVVFKVEERRGNARKKAASFETTCFRELDLLANALRGGWRERALERLRDDGVPALYPTTEEGLRQARDAWERRKEEAKAARKLVRQNAAAAKKALRKEEAKVARAAKKRGPSAQ